MSDPTQPAPADPAAPAVQPPAAPAPAPVAPVAAQPPAPPAPRVLNPYAAAPARPAAPAAVAPQAPPAEAAPTPAADPRIDGLMAALRESVGEQLAGISEGARKTVLDLAGDDPIAQRRILATLRANGVTGPVTLPPGASTAVPTQQPTPAPTVSPDAAHLAEYERARAVAPQYAEAYRAGHSASISRALAARSATH